MDIFKSIKSLLRKEEILFCQIQWLSTVSKSGQNFMSQKIDYKLKLLFNFTLIKSVKLIVLRV